MQVCVDIYDGRTTTDTCGGIIMALVCSCIALHTYMELASIVDVASQSKVEHAYALLHHGGRCARSMQRYHATSAQETNALRHLYLPFFFLSPLSKASLLLRKLDDALLPSGLVPSGLTMAVGRRSTPEGSPRAACSCSSAATPRGRRRPVAETPRSSIALLRPIVGCFL